MKTKLLSLCLCCSFLMSACNKKNTPEVPFNDFGVSFTCPSGWKIDEANDMDPGYFISVEKEGVNSSGIVTIGIVDGEIGLEEYLGIMKEELQSQSLFKNLKIEPEVKGSYGKYEGLTSSYKMNVLTVPHEGRIYVFYENDKSIYVMEQEATEDKKENASGFEAIKNSFTVNEVKEQ